MHAAGELGAIRKDIAFNLDNAGFSQSIAGLSVSDSTRMQNPGADPAGVST
jgi:hypothetical protein